jgi:hypothetical protein
VSNLTETAAPVPDELLSRQYCQHCGDWGGWYEDEEGVWVTCPCDPSARAARDAARARVGMFIVAHGPPPVFGCRAAVVGVPVPVGGSPERKVSGTH